MASKKPISTTDSTESDVKPKIPQPPPSTDRPVRVKSFPKRFRYGVDKSIPGVPTTHATPTRIGVRISEPAASKGTTVNTEATSSQRGKRKASIPDSESPFKTPRTGRTKESLRKRASTTSAGPSQGPSQASAPPPQPEAFTSPFVVNALSEIREYTSAPPGFNNSLAIVDRQYATLYQETFHKKDFCSTVSVDLEKIRRECHVDLSPWLKQIESFLSISAFFTPNIVKLFYFNMQWDNLLDSDDDLVEQRISTTVRGTKITISAAILNSILQIQNPPPPPTINYSNREIFAILRPNEPFPENQALKLTFSPVSMPPIHRVLWYIYSRNLVQKGGNYTHFTTRDYPLFAALVDKVPINIGHWLFQEITKFRFSSRKTSHIPFSSLVSVILFYHKVWYIGNNELLKKPSVFGKQQLNLMHIQFDQDEESGQSRAPSRTRATYSRQQEAQSAPPPPQQSFPANFDSRVKAIVDQAIADMTERIETEVGKLVEEVKAGNHAMVEAQDDLKEKVENITGKLDDQDARITTIMVSHLSLSDKVDKILKLLAPQSTAGPSSPIPKPEPSATASPSFTFTTPIITTSPPITPTTEAEPSSHTPTPATEILDPSTFVDDKGGEEPEEVKRD